MNYLTDTSKLDTSVNLMKLVPNLQRRFPDDKNKRILRFP